MAFQCLSIIRIRYNLADLMKLIELILGRCDDSLAGLAVLCHTT